MQNGTRMGSGNGYLIHLLIHSFVWITLSEDGNGIKKHFKGNEIPLISEISIHPLVRGVLIPKCSLFLKTLFKN